jgi:hypothetical protein
LTRNFKVIAYKDSKVIEDLELKTYLDYEKFWEKEEIDKVKIIADKINWKLDLSKNKGLDVW